MGEYIGKNPRGEFTNSPQPETRLTFSLSSACPTMGNIYRKTAVESRIRCRAFPNKNEVPWSAAIAANYSHCKLVSPGNRIVSPHMLDIIPQFRPLRASAFF